MNTLLTTYQPTYLLLPLRYKRLINVCIQERERETVWLLKVNSNYRYNKERCEKQLKKNDFLLLCYLECIVGLINKLKVFNVYFNLKALKNLIKKVKELKKFNFKLNF